MHVRNISRHWLPIVVAACTIVAAVVLRQRLASQENTAIAELAASQALIARSQAEAQMTSQILALSRLAIRWEIWGKPVETDWESEAAVLMSGYPGYQAIEWVDPLFRARWIAPLIGNEADEDLDFTPELRPRTALDSAEGMHDVVISRPIGLRQRGQGFLVCVPIFSGKKFEGFIVGVFRYQELLDRILGNVAGDYWVDVFDNGEQIYKRWRTNHPRTRSGHSEDRENHIRHACLGCEGRAKGANGNASAVAFTGG